ncbi:MAG: hypothetical protein AB7F86_05355 [Bdellovibrionales bacterium]
MRSLILLLGFGFTAQAHEAQFIRNFASKVLSCPMGYQIEEKAKGEIEVRILNMRRPGNASCENNANHSHLEELGTLYFRGAEAESLRALLKADVQQAPVTKNPSESSSSTQDGAR